MRCGQWREMRSGNADWYSRGGLRRSRDDRIVAGVAAGLAEHFGIDTALVRIAFVVTTIWGGLGALAYFVLWLVLPEGDSYEDVLAGRLERGEISASEYREMLADMAGASHHRRRHRVV